MAKDQWAINIDNELRAMENKSVESTRWSKRSIYRIPASVTDLNKQAYKPQIVSFGPYHHGMEHLKAMEEHKRRALLHFLKRSDNTIQSCIDVLGPVVQDLKDAYDQWDPKWNDKTDAFLEMMIVDGCFILEIVRIATAPTDQAQTQAQSGNQAQPHTQSQQQSHTPVHIQTELEDYAVNDPIFSKHGKLYILPYLRRDMLMLENQIPMLVLEKLVSIQKDNSLKKSKELMRRILKFFNQPITHRQLQKFPKCLHILDVYRNSLLLEEASRRPKQTGPTQHNIHQGDEIIRSATELNEAGITIAKSRTRSLKDISFHNGVLKLPLVVVDDALESLYLNMIAFERFHVGAGNEVTSYAFFMDNIIDKARDVSLLHDCGIIQNALGSDKAVANLFNALSKDVTLDPESSLDVVHKEVSAYCQKRWNKWRANLMHTYFTNPWASLSVVAAALLFALTIVQTVYSVLAYVNPS